MGIWNSQIYATLKQIMEGTKSLTITDFSEKVSLGLVPGATIVNISGINQDVDTADVPAGTWILVWPEKIRYVFPTSATITTMSSTNAADTQTILIDGLDANYQRVIQTKALNGQNKITLTTPIMRVNDFRNVTGVDLLGNVYLYEDTAITGGKPNDLTKIKDCMILNSVSGEHNNVTSKALYTVEAGKSAILKSSFAGMISKNPNDAVITGKVKPFGLVKYLSRTITVSNNGTGQFTFLFNAPPLLPEKTDIIIQCDDVSANDTGITAGFDLIVLDNAIHGLS